MLKKNKVNEGKMIAHVDGLLTFIKSSLKDRTGVCVQIQRDNTIIKLQILEPPTISA